MIDEGKARASIRSSALLVEIDEDVGDAGFPAQLQEQGRIVKRSGRSIDHMTTNAAVFARCEGLFAEFDELVLSGKTLPAVRLDRRRIDSAGGPPRSAGFTGDGTVRDRGAGAIRIPAIHRAREA